MNTGLNTLFNEISSRDILHTNSVLLGLGLAKQYIRPYAARHRFAFHRPTRSYAYGTIHTTENDRHSMLPLVAPQRHCTYNMQLNTLQLPVLVFWGNMCVAAKQYDGWMRGVGR
ncbi:Sphingosine N-acyltransferase-like protein FUM17 [Fusarium oxysporum f. sp. albedinis]|nr:Sphingosine N-acyltransferase-like protein FUM17 [Fusarium oxysporum f. sp. albedinis]